MRLKTTILALPLLVASAFAQNPPAPAAKPATQAEAPEPKYKVGDEAPDFTLKDQNRQDVSLSSFRGKKNVVLAFYVFAFTGG
jgi:cytochrome oxidase Cu insertion factor (SCO1/SenC/PrrC family)